MMEKSLSDWPDCSVSGCVHKVCLGVSDKYCFVHTSGPSWLKHLKITFDNWRYAIADWVRPD